MLRGKPTIRGLRLSVQSVLELLASGMTFDEVLADYPDLQRDDLLDALEYGALAGGRAAAVSVRIVKVHVDAQSPVRLCDFLVRLGRDAVHVSALPGGNRTFSDLRSTLVPIGRSAWWRSP